MKLTVYSFPHLIYSARFTFVNNIVAPKNLFYYLFLPPLLRFFSSRFITSLLIRNFIISFHLGFELFSTAVSNAIRLMSMNPFYFLSLWVRDDFSILSNVERKRIHLYSLSIWMSRRRFSRVTTFHKRGKRKRARTHYVIDKVAAHKKVQAFNADFNEIL